MTTVLLILGAWVVGAGAVLLVWVLFGSTPAAYLSDQLDDELGLGASMPRGLEPTETPSALTAAGGRRAVRRHPSSLGSAGAEALPHRSAERRGRWRRGA